MKQTILKLLILGLGATSLTACSGNIIPEDANSPQKAHGVTLTRVTQRVLRYDCQGKKTSDQIEEVNSPTDYMELHPTRSSWTYDNISSAIHFNKTSGDDAGVVYNHVKFTIDMDHDFFTMRVKSGLNELQYTFNFTDGEIEEGSRFINVTYKKEFKTEIQEVRPSKEQCEEPPLASAQ